MIVWLSILGTLVMGFYGIIPPLHFYVRLLAYVLLIAVVAFYGFVSSITLTLLGKQGLSQWNVARVFYYLSSAIFGLEIEIRNPGPLNVRPAVFVSNHQSELDIYMLGRMFPKWTSVTGKKALKYYPFLGWFMSASGSVFVDRVNRENSLKAFAGAVKHMKEKNQSVFIFPEGTRSHSLTPTMLPFKKGAFHFAQQAQVPVVPWVVSNYSHVFSFKTRTFKPGKIVVEVLEPFDTKGMAASDVNDLVVNVREKMEAVMLKLGYGEGEPYIPEENKKDK